MPVKWTPETDQILLLKILETSQVVADVKAISAAWPEGQEAPTPRAISERLVKIRATAKESGAPAKFSVSSGKNTSAPTTPRKRVAKAAVPKKAGGGIVKKTAATKRKRGGKADASPNSNSEDSGADAADDENMDESNLMEENHPFGEI